MTAVVARAGPPLHTTEPARWGLRAFVWLLPFHALFIAFCFGVLGWSADLVRVLAAWKEALVAGLLVVVAVRALRGRGTGLGIQWPDLAVGGLAALAGVYLVGAEWWFDQGLPIAAQLYGWRDAVLASLLYFVGRATPGVAAHPRTLKALYGVGVVTSLIAVIERLLVTPRLLVILGVSRYVQQFLDATPITRGNVYGLPNNYWTSVGGHLVQRTGSTYLSSQGFAIPFLIVLPAATLWLLLHSSRRSVVEWASYGLLWAGLLLTVTRMTIVACVLQTFAVAAAGRRWGMAVGLGVAGLAGVGLAVVLFPGVSAFIWETLTWQTGSSISHLADWGEAFRNALAHPLGAGLGAADFTAVRFGLTPLAADNEYFKYAVELGVLGLAAHMVVVGGLCATGFRAWRGPAPEAVRSVGLLVAVAALGMGLNALTAVVGNSTMLTYTFYWLAGSATSGTARAERARAG